MPCKVSLPQPILEIAAATTGNVGAGRRAWRPLSPLGLAAGVVEAVVSWTLGSCRRRGASRPLNCQAELDADTGAVAVGILHA